MEREKILIVDDEPLMCDSLKALLSNDGFEAKTSSSGLDALNCFSREGFDVILLDMHMPEMSGLELMDHIKVLCPGAFVVVITGRASVESIVESLRKGAFDYLRKPFEHEELLKTVKNALSQKRLERKRKSAEEQLRKAHEELEKRVEERTAELGKANALLIKEIDERKRAEQELQTINEEMKNFVRAVSHDMKNPLISVQGFSRRLLMHFGDVLGEKGTGYLEHIITNTRRMELLVSDLLTLSMIGQVVPKLRDVSCKEIVKDVISSLADRLKGKGVKTVVAEKLPVIHCDGERLYQVFENLMTNAIKFSGDVPKPVIEVGYEDRRHDHRFFVKDNGIGIDPEFHEMIFEKFCRLQEGIHQEGTGLGLPIVEKILEKLNGKVWVVSEKGKGAIFYFSIPKTIPEKNDETISRDRRGEKASHVA